METENSLMYMEHSDQEVGIIHCYPVYSFENLELI